MALGLLFELSPVPRLLYSASVPAFYTRVALDPRDVTLMELPVGVRDGTSSVGDFTARSQFFQTVHGKPLVGGYLSRVSRKRIAQLRQDPLLDALITLSEGGTLDGVREAALVERGPRVHPPRPHRVRRHRQRTHAAATAELRGSRAPAAPRRCRRFLRSFRAGLER
jgi:hypothetical protein